MSLFLKIVLPILVIAVLVWGVVYMNDKRDVGITSENATSTSPVTENSSVENDLTHLEAEVTAIDRDSDQNANESIKN